MVGLSLFILKDVNWWGHLHNKKTPSNSLPFFETPQIGVSLSWLLRLQRIPLLGDNAVLEALDFAYNAFCIIIFWGHCNFYP